MNPFFWILVLMAMVAIWFALRDLFIDIGTYVTYLFKDTRDVLEFDDSDIDNFNEQKGESNNE